MRALQALTVSASSTASGYAASNMANDHAGVVWKSAGGAASASVTVDMGSPVAIDAALFFGCTDARTSWTLTVESADNGSFSSGLVTHATAIPFLAGATFPSHGRGVGYWSASAPTAAKRYWRFTIGSLANAPVTIARLALGTKVQLERNFAFGGGWGVRDLGRVDFSAAGVRLRRRAVKLRTLGLSFPAVRKDEAEEKVLPLVELVAGQEPVVVVTEPDAHALRQQRCWIGHLIGELGTVWRTAAAWEWRANLIDLIPVSHEGVARSIYASYALALDFDDQDYWAGGTKAALLSSVSGYTFTRSGEQGALDGDGTVDSFAANVPAINSKGYHAYGALTNSLLQSQTFENASWLLTNSTVTANNTAAPSGTQTADKLTAAAVTGVAKIEQVYSGTSAGVTYSESVFVQLSTHRYAWLGDRSDAVLHSASFDLLTGTVLGTTNATASITAVAAGFYRCTIVYTRTNGGAASCTLALGSAAHTADNPSTTWAGTEALHLWQLQVLQGNFPDGGPIITTTTASASIGESVLSVDDAVGAESDQLFMATGSVRYSGNGRLAMWNNGASANDVVDIFYDGNLHGYITAGGVLITDQSLAYTAGDIVTAVVRRLAGQWRFGIVKNGVLTWASSVTGTFPSGMNKARVANYSGLAGWRPDGQIKAVARKLGAFDTDAKVLAAAAEVS